MRVEHKIVSAFGFAIFLLIVLGIAASWSSSQSREALGKVEHTYLVLDKLEGVALGEIGKREQVRSG